MGLKRIGLLCIWFCLPVLLPLLTSGSVYGALNDDLKLTEGPINIQADRLVYEEDDNVYRAEGNVLITYPGGTLQADEIILRQDENTAYAQGGVILKSDQDILEGESVIFHIDSRTGTVDGGKMFVAKNHVYASGSSFKKTGEATYHAQDAVVTTCDGPDPEWSLRGKELKVTIDGYGTLKHGTFYAGKLPVLYFPYLVFPVKTTRQTGFLLPYVSHSKRKNGVDIELPFFWAISENMDATFYQRFLSKRGFKEGAEFRYFLTPESSGVVYGDYLYRDRLRVRENNENLPSLSRDWDNDHDRWSFYLQHESAFEEGYYMRADIARVSDHWYFKDFSSRNYYREHYARNPNEKFKRVTFEGDKSLRSLDSKVRFSKDWSLFNLTALGRYTDDFTSSSNDQTLQQYPEITLTAVNQPLGHTPLRFDMVTSYNNYYRSEGHKGALSEIRPAVSLPFSLGPYAQVTPRFAWSGAFWSARGEDLAGVDNNGSRNTYMTGGMVTSEIHRIYVLQGKFVEKIRHGIRAEVGYDYSPHVKQSDMPDYVEVMDKQNRLTYALINTVMAKMKAGLEGPRYREIMRLKLSQTYDIDREWPDWDDDIGAKKRNFGTVDMEMDLNPLSYLSLKSRSRFDVHDGSWLRSNNDLVLTTPRGDRVSLGYHYTRDLIEAINLSLRAKINREIDLEVTLKQNELAKRTVEQTYAVNYQRQCWGIKVGYSDSADDRQIFASLNLFGFGF